MQLRLSRSLIHGWPAKTRVLSNRTHQQLGRLRDAACLDAVANAKDVAQSADDGRRVIGASRKYGSKAEAEAAKIAAAKAKREAASLAKK